jgi:dUTP pyrophosphatase
MGVMERNQAIVDMHHGGLAPSEIDKRMGLFPGTAHRAIVAAWAYEKEHAMLEGGPMITMYPDLKYVKVNPDAPDLRYAYEGDAGLDLCSMEDVEISPQGTVKVGSGIAVEIPDGFVGIIVPRSGMATKRGITIANTPGTIDSGYRDEVKLALYNIGTDMAYVNKGERVAQMIVMAYAQVTPIIAERLGDSERGKRGFGSSGTGRL